MTATRPEVGEVYRAERLGTRYRVLSVHDTPTGVVVKMARVDATGTDTGGRYTFPASALWDSTEDREATR